MIRCRFGHYQPQAIESVALTGDLKLLAVGRENKSVEIWKTESFSQLITIPGNQNVDLRHLHWIEPDLARGDYTSNVMYYNRQKGKRVVSKKRRLLSTGLNGMVIEWDLRTGQPKSSYSAGGAIWDSKVAGKFVYIACEDGSIRVLKVKKRSIELIKMLVKSESNCLSLEVVLKECN